MRLTSDTCLIITSVWFRLLGTHTGVFQGCKFVCTYGSYDDDVTATLLRDVDDDAVAFDSVGCGKGRRNSNTCGSGACSI